jgi:hypothetical protein
MNRGKDARALLLVSICHYLYGSIFLLIFIPSILLSLDGIKIMIEALPKTATVLIVLSVLLCIALIFSVCVITSGYYIFKRKRYQFSWNLARIEIAFFPLGTVLGFFTLYILSKESIKSLYEIRRQ